jgi:hypothetical protein
MRLQFSITGVAWLTAIVAFVAALPRRRHFVAVTTGDVIQITRLTRENWPLGWELLWRGVVVIILSLVVWLVMRARQVCRPVTEPMHQRPSTFSRRFDRL